MEVIHMKNLQTLNGAIHFTHYFANTINRINESLQQCLSTHSYEA